MRIAHVISEYSAHEAMGRTISETAARVPGEHHLVTTRAHDGAEQFDSVHAIGGLLSTFVIRRHRQLAGALDAITPDVVHLHGGALTPLWSLVPALRHRRLVQTIYGWPRVPGPAAIRRAGVSVSELRSSNVLRPRVVVSTLIPAGIARRALNASGTVAVLSPDPDARQRLDGATVPVLELTSGAELSPERARFTNDRPTVIFAGRAEAVRGIRQLLDAFAIVHQANPDARLRLLLIPTPELPRLLAQISDSNLGDSVSVETAPVADLAAELAAAQVGVWPFAFDHTTSPPAMALAEAMAAGLPVVSTPVTCVRSIATNGINADLVPVGDHRALAAAIGRLLTDRRLWEQRAAVGLRTIREDASWDRATRITAAAYGHSLVEVGS